MSLKFQRVYTTLQAKILSGEWPEGLQIPTEMELCAQFGVSRVTIRKALGGLVDTGYLSRIRGRGSFVRSSRKIIGGYLDEARSSVYRYRRNRKITILLREHIVATKSDIDQLQIKTAALGHPMLWHVRSLHLMDGQPSVVIDYYISEEIASLFVGIDDHPTHTFYEMLDARLGQRCRFVHGTLAAINPNDSICNLLGVPIGSANLWCRGVCRMDDGTNVARCSCIFNGRQFAFSINHAVDCLLETL